MKIRAITISGNTRITLNINLVIPVTGRILIKFCAPRKANGIQIIAAINVPITAIANVSSNPRNKSSPAGIYT